MDGDGSRSTFGCDGIHTSRPLLWSVSGHANVSVQPGMAKANDRGPSAYGTSWCSEWQAHACDPKSLRRFQDESRRTANPIAEPVFKDFARHSNHGFSR